MSFASETKAELCRIEPERECCRLAQCYGMFLFGNSFSFSAVSFLTESAPVARRAAQMAAGAAGVVAETASAVVRRGGRTTFSVSIPGQDSCERLLHVFHHRPGEMNLRIHLQNLPNECCAAAFLRGAFLCCGTVTAPEKGYDLEFSVPFMYLAKDLAALLSVQSAMNLQPGVANRKGSFVVYVRGGENVADLLAFLGAPHAAMELMQAKMLKEMRNNINRKNNFETANIDKTASAAARQLLAIEEIQKTAGLDSLPEDLRELARLRLENPELSLRELGGLLSPPLSRSGVNHRLRRIVEIAEQK
ncbi:MAG TPA: DNA-binding protein WhiA [Candidatus Caccousia avistercoris]|nr:DNA-binding protein WhiA [Candidatus Caccousia avistercoris]